MYKAADYSSLTTANPPVLITAFLSVRNYVGVRFHARVLSNGHRLHEAMVPRK